MLTERPIGIFDSGVGGLTVYRALRDRLPEESFVYLGDTARLPYGTKSSETVKRYAEQTATRLIQEDIKLLVVACNTATAQALPHLRARWPDLPILGVVEPGARAAAQGSRNGQMAVLATEGTIRSGAYQNAIAALRPDSKIQGLACNLLVALAEEGWIQGAETEMILRRYLAQITLPACDLIVLGCTHFPLLVPSLRKVLPSGTAIVDSAATTAQSVADHLADRGLARQTKKKSTDRFLVTDGTERFCALADLFLEKTGSRHVDLVSL